MGRWFSFERFFDGFSFLLEAFLFNEVGDGFSTVSVSFECRVLSNRFQRFFASFGRSSRSCLMGGVIAEDLFVYLD